LPSIWAALLVAVALLRPRESHRGGPPLLLPVLGFTAVTVLGGLSLTDHVSAALPAIRMTVVGSMMFYVLATLVRSRHQVAWVVAALALSAAVPGLAAIAEFRSGTTDYGFITASGTLVSRVAAGFAQPNQLGGFLVLLIPVIAGGMLVSRRGRPLLALGGVLGIVGIYLSFSRGALLGLAVAPLVLVGWRWAFLLTPVGAAVLALTAPDLLRERFATLSSSGSELATRADIWHAAEHIWTAHPLLGVGPGGFPDAYATTRLPGKEFLPTTLFEPPPHAHDLVLQVMAEQGVVGLLAFGALAVAIVAALLRVLRARERWVRVAGRAVLAGFAAFAVHNLFDVTLLAGTGEYVFALAGLASALAWVSRTAPSPGAAAGAPDRRE
jgi:O-antigen ligase